MYTKYAVSCYVRIVHLLVWSSSDTKPTNPAVFRVADVVVAIVYLSCPKEAKQNEPHNAEHFFLNSHKTTALARAAKTCRVAPVYGYSRPTGKRFDGVNELKTQLF